MTGRTAKKPYAKPIVQKRCRLTDIAEQNVVVSGSLPPKGGCFSNNR